MDFRNIVRRRMDELGVSQTELAEAAEVNRSTINRWLNEDTELASNVLGKVLAKLKLKVVPREQRKSAKKKPKS